jgi:hypothetical protein
MRKTHMKVPAMIRYIFLPVYIPYKRKKSKSVQLNKNQNTMLLLLGAIGAFVTHHWPVLLLLLL